MKRTYVLPWVSSLHNMVRCSGCWILVLGATITWSTASAGDSASGVKPDPAPFFPLAGLSGAIVQSIAVDPRIPANIYADVHGGRIARTTNAGAHWQVVQVGSSIEYFRAIAVDPAESATIVAVSSSDIDGGASSAVYASHDAGAHWSRLPHQPIGKLGALGGGRGIVLDQTGKLIVLSDKDQGIFRSSDFGFTWTNPLPGSQANTYPLVTDPNDPATLWTGGADPTNNNIAATWVSHDFGVTWRKLSLPLPDPGLSWLPTAIAVQPGTGKVLVGAGGLIPSTFGPIGRILASTDGGKTWTNSSSGLSDPALHFNPGNAIVFDPKSPANAYVSTNGSFGAFKSIDGGKSWIHTELAQVDSFFTLAVTGTRVYGGGSSFYASSDDGTSWMRLENGLKTIAAAAVRDDGSAGAGIYAISSTGELAHSSNGGGQWRAADPDSGIRSTLTIAVDTVSPLHQAYAFTRNGKVTGLWSTTDLGLSWSSLVLPVPASDKVSVADLVSDPFKAGRVYLLLATQAVRNGLFRSDDYGAHWSAFTIGRRGDSPAFLNEGLGAPLIADPANANVLYAAMSSGLWKSTDAGASWTAVSRLPLGSSGIFGLAVLDGASKGVYVVSNAAGGNFVIEKSTDGGQTWSFAPSGSLIYRGAPFDIAGGPGGRLFANGTDRFGPCFDQHVVQSTDGAATWSELPDAGVLSGFGADTCPVVLTTSSALYLTDTSDSFLTFGAPYGDLDGSNGNESSSPRTTDAVLPEHTTR